MLSCLGGSVATAAAVVVGPDDLVEKALTPEYPVEEHLAVVDLAVVQWT